MSFTFTIDPISYKQEMNKINKMLAAAADSGKPIVDPAQMKPKPKEFISVKTMTREEIPANQLERIVQSMLKNFREESYHTNEILIKDLLSKHFLWTNQASELLQMFKEE